MWVYTGSALEFSVDCYVAHDHQGFIVGSENGARLGVLLFESKDTMRFAGDFSSPRDVIKVIEAQGLRIQHLSDLAALQLVSDFPTLFTDEERFDAVKFKAALPGQIRRTEILQRLPRQMADPRNLARIVLSSLFRREAASDAP